MWLEMNDIWAGTGRDKSLMLMTHSIFESKVGGRAGREGEGRGGRRDGEGRCDYTPHW